MFKDKSMMMKIIFIPGDQPIVGPGWPSFPMARSISPDFVWDGRVAVGSGSQFIHKEKIYKIRTRRMSQIGHSSVKKVDIHDSICDNMDPERMSNKHWV